MLYTRRLAVAQVGKALSMLLWGLLEELKFVGE
jgi:hypothetical protein